MGEGIGHQKEGQNRHLSRTQTPLSDRAVRQQRRLRPTKMAPNSRVGATAQYAPPLHDGHRRPKPLRDTEWVKPPHEHPTYRIAFPQNLDESDRKNLREDDSSSN